MLPGMKCRLYAVSFRFMHHCGNESKNHFSQTLESANSLHKNSWDHVDKYYRQTHQLILSFIPDLNNLEAVRLPNVAK